MIRSKMFNPPHPGGILVEELEHLSISADDFARQIGVDTDLMTRIVNEN